MSKIHPTVSRIEVEDASTSTCPSVWTVWKKSSMAFQGTDGFSIYDSKGRLSFRVDNYSRKHKCLTDELLLMDGEGRVLLSLKPQIMSLHDRWNGYKAKEGLPKSSRPFLFSMRRRRSILQTGDVAEVFMGSSETQSPVPNYIIEGCFRRRFCKIRNTINGEEVAQISRKTVGDSVTLGDDVFTLTVQPGVESELIMAFIVIMDRIC